MEADTVIDILIGQDIGGAGGGLNGGNGSGTVSQMSSAAGGTQTGGAAFGAGEANGRWRWTLWWIWSLTALEEAQATLEEYHHLNIQMEQHIRLPQLQDKMVEMGKQKLHL